MKIHSSKGRTTVVLLITALTALGLASSAQAKLTGNFARFAQCPFSNPAVARCIYSTTESGEVVLGSKKVPIVKPVVLQGGLGPADEETFNASFFAASNGVTLSKAAQPVPGGLAGLVECKKISEPFLRFACELTFENGLTGLNSTLELARPASEIVLNEIHLIGEEGVALKLPVKVHLENPFLGSSCYVGSSTSPIIWNLTSGTTKPPEPNKPIKGNAGGFELLNEGQIVENTGMTLVENAWSAPGATGCGGFLVELILNPIINAAAGLPAAAGHNSAVLNNTAFITAASAVSENNAKNP